MPNVTDKEIATIVNTELDKAEEIWLQVEPVWNFAEGGILEHFEKADVQTQIPSHPLIRPGVPKVDTFVAMVLDIRKSSEHLRQAISKDKADVSQLERVFYETTAVFSACSLIVNKYNGGVTEYLGDGFLSLFHVPERSQAPAIRNAYRAANRCMEAVQNVVNLILKDRFRLPPLSVGIGMGYSQAVVTVVGIGDNLQAKALGECVFWATKLAYGSNQIFISKQLKHAWPQSKGGLLKFISRQNPKNADFSGFLVTRKN